MTLRVQFLIHVIGVLSSLFLGLGTMTGFFTLWASSLPSSLCAPTTTCFYVAKWTPVSLGMLVLGVLLLFTAYRLGKRYTSSEGN